MASGRQWCRRALAPCLTGVALLGCVVQPPDPWPPDSRAPVVAHLTADSPDIHVRHAGQPVPYSPGMPLRRGDGVRTGTGTSATIEFTDGNIVYLRTNTFVEVGTIRLFFGEIFNWVRNIASGGSTTYTNDLAAAAESTMFLVRTARGGDTIVTVVEGRVQCRPSRGARWAAVSVGQNQQLTATARARSSPRPVDARGAALWVNDTARRLNRPPVIIRAPIPQPVTPQPGGGVIR